MNHAPYLDYARLIRKWYYQLGKRRFPDPGLATDERDSPLPGKGGVKRAAQKRDFATSTYEWQGGRHNYN